jgi:hypothetical protein
MAGGKMHAVGSNLGKSRLSALVSDDFLWKLINVIVWQSEKGKYE